MRWKNLIFYFFILAGLVGCVRQVEEPNTIIVWHWMVDRDEVFKTLAVKYEKETGIKVEFQLYAPDVYSKKIIAAAQARILPEIYGILDKKYIVSEFIKNGFVADLTADFKKDNGAWEKTIFPQALAVNRFDEENVYGVKPGIYGVPLDVMNIQMLYNKKLLKKAGINKPPKTFDEFLTALKTLNLIGIPGLVSGWGEVWMIDCFSSNYAFNIMGEDKVMATYRGEVPYTDPDWIKVFEIFDTLSKQGGLSVGIVTKTNKYAEQDFALERAAFAFNGSWCVNVYNDMNPDLEYGVMLPPAISRDFPMKIWGAAGSSFFVNAASSKKKKAIAFLRWLSAKEQQSFLAKETNNAPANRHVTSSISKLLSDFVKAMKYTTHPMIWPLDEDAIVKERFRKGLQSIVIGEKTPQQVAAEVQAVKERQIEKKRRRRDQRF